MDENVLHSLLRRDFEQREKMIEMRMDTAIANQSEQMQSPLPPARHCLLEERHVAHRLLRDKQVDARHVHVHDAPRADVEMADFAVAHLPIGQTHGRP